MQTVLVNTMQIDDLGVVSCGEGALLVKRFEACQVRTDFPDLVVESNKVSFDKFNVGMVRHVPNDVPSLSEAAVFLQTYADAGERHFKLLNDCDTNLA